MRRLQYIRQLQDREAGRSLETEAIWGELFRRGRAAGARTPRLDMVYNFLRYLDGARQIHSKRPTRPRT